MIKANAHKYSMSAMCKVLPVSRSTYYYEAKQKTDESELTAAVMDIFKASRNNFQRGNAENFSGTRRKETPKKAGRITGRNGTLCFTHKGTAWQRTKKKHLQ